MKLAHVQGLKGEESVQHFMAAVVVALSILAGSLPGPARAQTIIDEWASAKLPAPPELKPVTIDPKETALLVMDFTNQTCTPQRRLRCANSVPKVQALVAEARAKGAFLVYSVAVPVDGMSGDDAWPELYTAWHLANAARISGQVTLTRMDMVKF